MLYIALIGIKLCLTHSTVPWLFVDPFGIVACSGSDHCSGGILGGGNGGYRAEGNGSIGMGRTYTNQSC